VVHVEYLIKAGAEQILFSRLAPFAWSAHRLAPIHCDESSESRFAKQGNRKLDCKKTIHKLAVTCNSEICKSGDSYGISAASKFFTAD
jgi:hypothetical protein